MQARQQFSDVSATTLCCVSSRTDDNSNQALVADPLCTVPVSINGRKHNHGTHMGYHAPSQSRKQSPSLVAVVGLKLPHS